MAVIERMSVPAPEAVAEPSALEGFERSLMALSAWLNDRSTLGDLAQRSGYSLSPTTWALLEHLDARGAMRVSDIAACHGVRAPSITPRLQWLEEHGLVARGTDPADGRVSMIAITGAGRAALESIHAARRDALAATLDGIPTDEIERATDVLAAVAARLSRDRGS